MRLGFSSLRMLSALIIAVVAGFGVISAQVSTSRGTMGLVEGRRYMVAFPKVWASKSELPLPVPMTLFISSKVKAKVRIETPAEILDASKISKDIDLQPNIVAKISVPVSYMNSEHSVRKGYGISVTSDQPISVTTYQAWNGNGEMARHLPVEAWGKNYYSMNFYQDRYNSDQYRPSQILIIAEKNNTVVTFSPRVDTEGGPDVQVVKAGATGTVNLNRGETFLLENIINKSANKDWTSDLSGSMIRANKPIGVVSGHTKVAIMRYPDFLPPGGATEAHFVRNNVHDAMLPVEMAGKEFITVPAMYTSTRVTGQVSAELGLDDDRGDVIRVVALEPNTTISVRTQNGSALIPKARLTGVGDSYKETALEVPTYWVADKPVLVGQYGKSWAKIIPPGGGSKDGETVQGHPTVESGMPMLQYVPSVDRWVNYGVFSSPEGLNNFFNIAFKTAEVNSIKFDGVALASRFGGAIRPIQGTEYSIIRSPVSIGDHVVESVTESVRWAGWCYGSLDGMEMGRAYGTPISVDLAISCPDSLDVIEQLVCGDVVGDAKILPENTTCGSVFAVYSEALSNYNLIVDPNFSAGDKKAHFNLNVVDKTKDASATILVVSRSGKYIRKTYTYVADKISFTPPSVNFGTIALGTAVDKTITVKNEMDRPVNVKNVKVKSFPGVFSITPKAFVLAPFESKVLTVTAMITATTPRVDTVIAELDCFDVNLSELKVRGEEPLIYVSDANWGRMPKDAEGQREVRITNSSKVELLVTGYDQELLPDAKTAPNKNPNSTSATTNFWGPVDAKDGQPIISKFPLKLAPAESYAFKVWYSPKGVSAEAHRVDVPFLSNADGEDSIAVLQGEGTQTGIVLTLPEWNVRVVDGITQVEAGNYPTTMGQAPNGKLGYYADIVFGNVGTQTVTFTSAPTISGPDAKYFSIDATKNNFGGYPVQLKEGSPNNANSTIRVYFTPEVDALRATERNDFKLEVALNVADGTPAQPEDLKATSTSQAWLPYVLGNDLDFGTFQSTDAAVIRTIPIKNEDFALVSPQGDKNGTHTVAVYDVKFETANRGKFTVVNAPTNDNPWVIKPGETIDMQVRFSPTEAGPGEYLKDADGTQFRLVTRPAGMGSAVTGTPGAATIDPTYWLSARVIGGEFTVSNAYDAQYVLHKKTMTLTVAHNSNVEGVYTVADPVNTDGRIGSAFTIISPANRELRIPANSTGKIIVEFEPQVVTKLANGQNANIFGAANNTNPDEVKAVKAGNSGLKGELGQMYKAGITVTDFNNQTVSKVAEVTGDGLFLETSNYVGKYEVDVNKSVDVAVELKNIPEALTGHRVSSIRIRISYDPTLVRPVDDARDLIQQGTQSQGWRVVAYNAGYNSSSPDQRAELELDLLDETGTMSLSNDNSLAIIKVPFRAFLGRGLSKSMTSDLGLTTYWLDHSDVRLPENNRTYVFINDQPGEIKVNLTCATTKRLVSVSGFESSVGGVAPNPVVNSARINYSIGLDGNTRIVLVNSMGQEILNLVNEYQQMGTYEMDVDFSQLPAGVYYYRVISGSYVSEDMPLNIVR